MQKEFRSTLLRAALTFLVATLALAACAPSGDAPGDQTAAPTAPAATAAQSGVGRLSLLEWAGYDVPAYWKPFADQYPAVKVDFSYFAEDAEALTKLQSGYDADLVHPCSPWIGQYVELGLVQPIDVSRLKNWPGVNSDLAALGQIDGKQYLVPWDWGFESILVRSDKVKTLPTSWADLWNPEYKGFVSFFDSGEPAWVIAATVLGYDPYNTTPAQQAEIKQKLLDLKPNLLNYWTDSTELAGMISSGDVHVAGDAWQDIYFTTKSEGVPVAYIDPKEGRLSFVCGFAISSQAKNLDLAYAYIDAALDPQSMANMANDFAYGASNFNALPLIDPAIVQEFHLDNPDVLKDTIFYQPLTTAQRELFTSTWSDVKAAP